MPRKKQNIGENLSTWVIKDVDEQTRRVVRTYAEMNGMTTAQALSELIALGVGVQKRTERLERILDVMFALYPPNSVTDRHEELRRMTRRRVPSDKDLQQMERQELIERVRELEGLAAEQEGNDEGSQPEE